MPEFPPAESFAPSVPSKPARRLRCPSCFAHLDLGQAVAGRGWVLLHRCGDHVIEAEVDEPGVPPVLWRWRALDT